jgi:hypothetical protein
MTNQVGGEDASKIQDLTRSEDGDLTPDTSVSDLVLAEFAPAE